MSPQMITSQQIALVQASFEPIKTLAGEIADLFYGRLFAITPAFRSLFPTEMAEQKRKLVAMLALAVANLHRMEVVQPALAELGRRHVGYGVTTAHYDAVGDALLWTLAQGLGPAFTEEVSAAWAAVYAVVSDAMKQQANSALEAAA